MKTLLKDCSLSAVIAGLIATLISYAGPLVIIFQAAHGGGLPPELLSSWIWAISLGSGVLGLVLSLYFKVPVVIAWSIPGSALLVSSLPEVGLNQAIGAYLVASLILLVIGLSGAFDRIIACLPSSIAAGMQAGILFSFGAALFQALPAKPLLVLAMFVAYVAMRRFNPRYAVVLVLGVGLLITLLAGDFRRDALVLRFATPHWVMPEFSLHAILNLALPLVLVTLTGQFMPGMAVLRNAGYQTPASPLVSASALASALLAPFGCHGLNLAAVTASLCTGREAHEDPRRRYVAALAGSLLYLLLGLFGTTLVSLFVAFPAELIAALAGLALFGAISEALARTTENPPSREAGLFTFLVTASGMSFLGLTAPFWGLLFGVLVHGLQQAYPCRSAPPAWSSPKESASK